MNGRRYSQCLSSLLTLTILATILVSCQKDYLAKSERFDQRLVIRDAMKVPGSTHFASMLAFGDFIVHMGGEERTIRCEGIPGISGVETAEGVKAVEESQPQVHLRRLMTHFHFEDPDIVIEQNPFHESIGTLVGDRVGGIGKLLPGKATFYQYIYLTLEGRVLANREPLIMSAAGVTTWPPIGSTFESEGPTHFYDIKDLEKPDARPFATLSACKAVVKGVISMPQVETETTSAAPPRPVP